MVQKYSSGEISREQYIRTSELKYQARTELWDYHLIYMYIFVLTFYNSAEVLEIKQYPAQKSTSISWAGDNGWVFILAQMGY
jgi:hypothetical protein